MITRMFVLVFFFRSTHCGPGGSPSEKKEEKRKSREKSVESLWNHHNLLFVDESRVFHSSKQTQKYKNIFSLPWK